MLRDVLYSVAFVLTLFRIVFSVNYIRDSGCDL